MKHPEYIPSGRVFRFLIPPEPRRYPGQRWAKMLARASHVVFAGIYLGAFVFEVAPEQRVPWFLAAMLSGFLMLSLTSFYLTLDKTRRNVRIAMIVPLATCIVAYLVFTHVFYVPFPEATWW